MNINIVFLLVQIGLISSIFSLIKLYNGEKFYIAFYIYIIASYLTEVIINRLINTRNFDIANIISNVYFLLEFTILILLIGKIIGHKNINKIIILPTTVFWIIENTLLHKIYESEKYFNVIASIILFVISIYSLTTNLNKNYKTFFKEADIVIIIAILFNISFRIVFEFLYYNYENNIPIIESIGNIFILVNFITNILFIYCLACIKNTKRLISSF